MFTISDFRVLVGNSCGSPCHYRFVTVICLLEHSSGVSAVACLDILDSAIMFSMGLGMINVFRPRLIDFVSAVRCRRGELRRAGANP